MTNIISYFSLFVSLSLRMSLPAMVVSAAVLVVGRDSHITAVAVLLSVRGLADACIVGLAVGATSNLVEFSAPRISHSLGWWQG